MKRHKSFKCSIYVLGTVGPSSREEINTELDLWPTTRLDLSLSNVSARSVGRFDVGRTRTLPPFPSSGIQGEGEEEPSIGGEGGLQPTPVRTSLGLSFRSNRQTSYTI